MSKADSLKEKISKYRELLKLLIMSIIAILTGISTIAYQILINKIPFHTIFLGLVGLVVVFLLSMWGLKLWNKLEELEKELESE